MADFLFHHIMMLHLLTLGLVENVVVQQQLLITAALLDHQITAGYAGGSGTLTHKRKIIK